MFPRSGPIRCWDFMGDIADQVGANRNAPAPAWYQANPPPATPAVDPNAPDSPETNAKKRAAMVALVNKWMPTKLTAPKIPDDEKGPDGLNRDLLALAGWTKQRGIDSKAQADAHVPVVTSCGDTLTAILKLWKSNIMGAFNIRDQTLVPSKDGKSFSASGPGAIALGIYVKANGTNKPKPGDILILRNGTGPGSDGTVGHVGIFVEETDDGYDTVWRVAAGGGGMLPDQVAEISDDVIESYDRNVPVLHSPTDTKKKTVDGWIDLDKLKQTGNWTL